MGSILRFLSELFSILPHHACQWRDPKPNRHPFTYNMSTYYCSACETPRAGKGDQLPTFHPNAV